MSRLSILIGFIINREFSKAQVSGAVKYGDNKVAGHYLSMQDSTKIYYECYAFKEFCIISRIRSFFTIHIPSRSSVMPCLSL